MKPILTILTILAAAVFIAQGAMAAETPVRDREAPDIALPDLPIYRALPELVTQCGIPHAIMVYGTFPEGIMAKPGLWLPAFTHTHGHIGAILDDWCRGRHFAWEEDPVLGVITFHPEEDAHRGAVRALLDQALMVGANETTLSSAIDTERLEKTCGIPVHVEIDGPNRMMRSGFAYASRSSTPVRPRDPKAADGTVAAAFMADMAGAPGLHWQIWEERAGTPPEVTISAITLITRPERTASPLAQVLTNLDPGSQDLAGYLHAMTRDDDAALELFRRLVVDRAATTAELDRKAFLAGLVGAKGDRTDDAQGVVKELVGFGDPRLTTALCAEFDRLPAEARVNWYEHALPWPTGTGMVSERSVMALWMRLLADTDPDLRGYAKLVLKDVKSL